MIVTINGITVEVQGNKDNAYPSFERNCMEERDSGSLTIRSTRETRYEMYDLVDVTNPSEQYLVQQDIVTQLNATDYQHSLELMETISYFDTIYPADRSFRKLGQTLGDILLVYKRELATFHNITITYDTLTASELAEIIPFKEFTGLNLSQILQSLFRKIWAVPKAIVTNGTWDIFPQYHNEKNNLIDGETRGKTWQQNNIGYATRVKSQLKNAVNENNSVWFPSETGYVLPRSTTYEKSPSKMRYELDSPIILIEKAEVIDVDYDAYDLDLGDYVSFTNQTVDITSQIVQNQEWDKLPNTSSINEIAIGQTDNLKNHIQFKVGERYITNLFEANGDNILFLNIETTFLINALVRALLKKFEEDGDYEYLPIYYSTLDKLLKNIDENDTENIKLRVKYIKQRNMDLIHSRKSKGVMNTSTTIHTQRDSSVEAGQYLRNLKFYSNRMGNRTFSKHKMFNYDETPYEVFDYTDEDTIVTRRKNTHHSNYILCEYEESENFANIEAEYALLKRSDPYTISGKSVTTNLIWEEFIEFSVNNKPDDSSFKLTSDAKRLALGLFENSTFALDKLAVGVFKPSLTSWDSDYAIHMPVEITGNGNNVSMHVFFDNQNIAAKTYYDLDNDTLQTYLNPLPYTDGDGRLEDATLYFTPDIQFNDTGEYPLILDETSYLANKYTNGVEEPIDLDSNAAYAYTHTISYVADDNIYIGDSVAIDNYLFNTQSSSTITIWKSTKPYGQFDQAPRSYDTNVTSSVSYSYNSTTHTITITPSTLLNYFAIVKDGKILLAINETVVIGQTYNVYANFLIRLDEYVTIEITSSLSIVASDSYNIFRNYSMVETSSLGIGVNDSYTVFDNFSLSGSASLGIEVSDSYTKFSDSSLDGDVTLGIDVSDSYTVQKQIELESLQSTTLGIEVSDSYTAEASIEIENSESTTLGIGVNDSYATNRPVEWVEGGTTETINQTCDEESDIDNVKSEITGCQFVENGDPYTQPIDKTTSPTCSDGQLKTVCLPDGNGAYICQNYVGENILTYYTCSLEV